VCGVYITGWRDGFVVGKTSSDLICLPPNMTGGELADIFVRNVRTYGDTALSARLKENPAEAMAGALRIEFPCPKH
jgi:hypothetical protein